MERLANTRLQSSLVWGVDPAGDLFPQNEPSEAPVTGPVPARWRAFLDARHLNTYYARIVHCVRHPVEHETRPGLRRVSVLGAAVFEIDANGFVKPYLWTWEDGEFGCFAWPDAFVAVGNTPEGWTWLERFRQGFVAELARRLQREHDELDEYSDWVFARLRRRVARECDLRHMRELVAAALALDPLALQVARRIRFERGPVACAMLSDYNHAIAHLAAYRKLQKEAPNLVPLYAAHADDLPDAPGGEPAQRLKQHLVEGFGLQQSTWDFAHNARPRWIYLIGDFYDALPAEATLDLLRVLQIAGCRRAPPRWYLWNVLQVFGHPSNRRNDYALQWEDHARALRRLTTLVEAADARLLEEMRENIYTVLIWMVDDHADLTRGIGRAGWTWFLRRATEWREHQEKLAAAMPGQWPAPFDSFRAHEHTVKVLRSHHALLAESRAMSHCVDTYAERCAGGGHLVLSIRRDGRARPLGTAHLRLERSRWRVVSVAGTANTVPRPAAARLATEACERLNAMRWRPPEFEARAAAREQARAAAARSALLEAPDDILEEGETA